MSRILENCTLKKPKLLEMNNKKKIGILLITLLLVLLSFQVFGLSKKTVDVVEEATKRVMYEDAMLHSFYYSDGESIFPETTAKAKKTDLLEYQKKRIST